MDSDTLFAKWRNDPEYLRACKELAPELYLDEAVLRWLADHKRKIRWMWLYRLGQRLILMATR